MGCYDMIVGSFVCPYCGDVDRVVLDQTKEFECTFKNLGLGDLCSNYMPDQDIQAGDHRCQKCKNEYGYSVKFTYGRMSSIFITDKAFNSVYRYYKPSEIKPKTLTEEDFKNKVKYLNSLREEFMQNQNKISLLTSNNNAIQKKIQILEQIVRNSAEKVFST